MMEILRRKQAPIAEESWQLIDEQAREILRGNLSARKFVRISGPHGWDYAAVNVGRLDPGQVSAGDGVMYGIRKVQPLVEVRVPFLLDLWELDNAARGARDINLDPLIDAARRIASFEERAIYYGFPPGNIAGLAQATAHEVLQLSSDASNQAERVARAVVLLEQSGEEPPYTLVAGPRLFESLEGEGGGYPPRKQIENLIDGPILLSPFVEAGFLVPSDREDEFELVLGADLSIGYEVQEGRSVRLYLTESFTFRVLEPQAVVAFRFA